MSKVEKEREGTNPQNKEKPDSSFVVPKIISSYSRDLQSGDHVEIPATRKSDAEYLSTAIGMLQEFAEGFSIITPEDLRHGGISALKRRTSDMSEIVKYTPADLFSRKCEIERKIDPTISRVMVASKENARTRIMLEELRALPKMEHFYLDHPIYKMIADPDRDYLAYLNAILDQKQPEESSSPQKQLFTFKGKHKPKQRNVFRRGLIEEGFIADISEGDFEYWFSEKPIYNDRPRINFLTHANHATYMLRELVDDYENPKLNKHLIANLCLSFPNDPNTKIDSNTYPTKSRKYINKFNKIFNRTT